jgi:hypothetical protein
VFEHCQDKTHRGTFLSHRRIRASIAPVEGAAYGRSAVIVG